MQAATLEDYAKDADTRDLIEHNFRVAVESCSDLALLYAAHLRLPEPARRRDVFATLSHADRLPTELAGKLAELASLRNRLVHQYLAVDPVLMLQHLRDDVKHFEQIAAVAIAWAEELDASSA
ncbi:MAG: DUF86 domain-containing protein [Chloroflexi bacterium]|nr:DUF86 domain-containing protein [Chloroflexota bacterium]